MQSFNTQKHKLRFRNESKMSEPRCHTIELTEQGWTSHQTHYRSYRGRVFHGSNDPTNGVKEL